ncbi:hypothetical protein, partial [Streptomyces caniscabiei]|uniref:hypothetical protein n=1 Tax=Streptomyces caniscabiei TaxID=2746961 RepID=UPI0038F7A913
DTFLKVPQIEDGEVQVHEVLCEDGLDGDGFPVFQVIALEPDGFGEAAGFPAVEGEHVGAAVDVDIEDEAESVIGGIGDEVFFHG